MRKLLAQFHRLDAQICQLTTERTSVDQDVADTKLRLADVQHQAQREVQGFQPATYAPHPNINRLIHRLAASAGPTAGQALAQFAGAVGIVYG